MKLDIAAIRARAGVAVYLEEWDKLARTDVPALCDRVEALEAALREAHENWGCGGALGSSPGGCFFCKALADEE